jgi:hypothetical protein
MPSAPHPRGAASALRAAERRGKGVALLPIWLRYVLLGSAWTTAVGLVARRILLAGSAYGGRLALVAAWIAAAAALAAAVVTYVAPRRPYFAGAVTGWFASLAAAMVVLLPGYDPGWWPVAVTIAAGIGVIGAFAGVVVRWAVKRDGPGSLRPAGGHR